jgi:hypothetical protein
MNNNYKLGLGPMSDFIISSIYNYAVANDYPLMVIASRNQIDTNGGYVMTTEKLAKTFAYHKPDNVLLCRDHCGPYFLDSEKQLSETDAVEATKKTIAADIEAGFDLIHIDTSRVSDGYKTAEDLISFALGLNPNLLFEFGTEENVGVAAGVSKYKADVDFAKQFPGMEFVVAQTGSLVMENYQAGGFESDVVRELVNYANQAGVKLKEHNADYLTVAEIALRKDAGVHAVNVAPQLGVRQTEVLKRLCEKHELHIDWQEFSLKVLESGKWRKWHINCDDQTKVLIAGHYLWQDPVYQNLIEKIGTEEFQREVYQDFCINIDRYKNQL